MPMIPPLVRDPPPDERQSSTGRPVSARMVRPQRRYASNFNVSFEYEPPPPIAKLGVPAPATTFDKWRAAAELDPPGGGAGDPSKEAARGAASASGVASAARRTLHDVLLGTTAVVLLGVVGGIGYIVWSGAVPGMAASPGGAAPKGSSLAAVVQPLMDLGAKAMPDRTAALAPAQDGAADTPAPRPTPPPAAPPPLPSAAPIPLVLATSLADKPALTVPPPSPASGLSAMAREAAPAPERVAAGAAPVAKPSDPDAAPPVPALPSAAAEAMSVPAPDRATAAVVPPAKAAVPDATPPMPVLPAKPAPTGEQVAAKAVPPAKPSEPDTALAVPAVAAMTVRLPPAPEWMAPAPAALASLSEAAALPSAPPALPVCVLTGGEPLLQVDRPLVDALRGANFLVAVETNGTQPLPCPIDWVCVSPKAGAPLVLADADELKLVYPQAHLTPDSLTGFHARHRWLSPMDAPRRRAANTRAAAAYCCAHPEWRLAIQAHKTWGVR